MDSTNQKLADIHLHLYGSIHWKHFLEFVKDRSVDWTPYELSFREAYGELPAVHEILDRYNLGRPGAENEFRRLFVFQDEDGGNFARFQAKYNMLNCGIKRATLGEEGSAFSTLVYGVCHFMHQILKRQLAENIGYAEQRMTLPSGFTRDQARQMLLAMLDAYSEYEGSDIQPRLAVSLSRDNPWPGWEVTREVALGPSGHLLTGIDFCYLEEGHPPKEQREFFEAVKEFNRAHPERALAILYHVGESFSDKSLESAVRWVHEAAEMGVHRLGHAIALGVSPDRYGVHSRRESVAERMDQFRYDLRNREGLSKLGVPVDDQAIAQEMDRLRSLPRQALLTVHYDEQRLKEMRLRQRYAAGCISALGSVVEICPTSNRRVGGISRPEHHPIVQLCEWGVPFVVGSDDPGIFDTTLAKEIEVAISLSGLPADFFDEIAERSWRYRSEVLVGRAHQDLQ